VLMITVALAVLVTRGQLNPHDDLTRTEQARLRTRLEEVNLQTRAGRPGSPLQRRIASWRR